MQQHSKVSLNALKIFVTVAKCGSHKVASTKLGVTPGAVSQQVRNLERVLGVKLLCRSNNSFSLTSAGQSLLGDSVLPLEALDRALGSVVSGANEISVQAPVTLATRWLIPKLEVFRNLHPTVRIRVETVSGIGEVSAKATNVSIGYFTINDLPTDATVLLEDRCRPYLSPDLLSRFSSSKDYDQIPVLQSADANWDWKIWQKAADWPHKELNFTGHFDLDDAALKAATASLGMVLAPDFIVREDVCEGRLCSLPDAPEILLGAYTLHQNGLPSRRNNQFVNWLKTLK